MKTIRTFAVVLLAGAAEAQTVNFDNLKTGAPPPGWTATKTGSGAAKWTIEQDDSAPSKPNVLKQSGQATYPVCIKDDTSLKDGFVEVKFKPISGKEDQAGGLVWRAKDSNNYYIARANALENNVVLYKVENGIRLSTAPKGLPSRSYSVKHPVPRGHQWIDPLQHNDCAARQDSRSRADVRQQSPLPLHDKTTSLLPVQQSTHLHHALEHALDIATAEGERLGAHRMTPRANATGEDRIVTAMSVMGQASVVNVTVMSALSERRRPLGEVVHWGRW